MQYVAEIMKKTAAGYFWKLIEVIFAAALNQHKQHCNHTRLS